MKIKGYWKITYRGDSSKNHLVVKAKSIQKAMKKFYKIRDAYWIVVSIQPLSVEVLEENEKED